MGDEHSGYGRKVEPPPSDDTFEIGLVMAGAISAGAYTAGVLDFLIEALDEWEAEKKRLKGTAQEHSIPQHNVRIRVVTGASAGSLSAAILAVAARYDIPHFSTAIAGEGGYAHVDEAVREIGASNPFYKAWVQDMSMERLLDSEDLNQPGAALSSLLNSAALMAITRHALEYPAHSIPAAEKVTRDYLADPVRYIFTLDGMSELSVFAPSVPEDADTGRSRHKDFRSFSISYGGNAASDRVKADDVVLDWAADVHDGWHALGMTALASGAFPIGFAARPRVDLARNELAGRKGCNLRDGLLAHRTILMIDPFSDAAGASETPAPQPPALLPLIRQLMGAWSNQARFNAEELALAADESVYSRFLISPRRERPAGATQLHIACGALGGLSGLFHIEYRHHDYLLGRRNAQKFLTDGFTLPLGNSLFKHAREHNEAGLLAIWGSDDVLDPGVKHLPIIPLVQRLRSRDGIEELPSQWPVDLFRAESLHDAISERLDKVVGKTLEPLGLSFVDLTAAKAGMWMIKGRMIEAAIKAINDSLIAAGLGIPAVMVADEVIFAPEVHHLEQPPKAL
ncbi:patatin-like phospholipase family protein [Pseudomonas sp. NA-150]|uniref:patatin-like phospholipase family protein n=1 Tax=Pseudomonas sp. NA-150 TaxID=3367525 RepID=UPI0037C6FECE